jgi:hypothetical protein
VHRVITITTTIISSLLCSCFHQVLGAPAGFFSSLVSVVVNEMRDVFPELAEREKRVVEVLADEERAFNRTLDAGIKHFKKVGQGSGWVGVRVGGWVGGCM